MRDLHLSAGAGFGVVLTSEIMRMLGLPRVPRTESVALIEGRVVGLL